MRATIGPLCKTVLDILLELYVFFYLQLKSSYGEPRDGGYQEFLKTCTYLDPFMSPTKYNKLCKGYILPSGTYLHDIMIQPYYDSRTIQAKDSDVIVDAFPKTGKYFLLSC